MDDQTAIERCRAGDSEAFRHVVERYQAEAIGHAVAILGNREDAMDAVQEAFIDTFKALKRIDLTAVLSLVLRHSPEPLLQNGPWA